MTLHYSVPQCARTFHKNVNSQVPTAFGNVCPSRSNEGLHLPWGQPRPCRASPRGTLRDYGFPELRKDGALVLYGDLAACPGMSHGELMGPPMTAHSRRTHGFYKAHLAETTNHNGFGAINFALASLAMPPASFSCIVLRFASSHYAIRQSEVLCRNLWNASLLNAR